jgi:hypothetical protein
MSTNPYSDIRETNMFRSKILNNLRRYTTSLKVAGSSRDEFIAFFLFTYFFQPHHGPVFYSAYNRNEYQKIYLEESVAGP